MARRGRAAVTAGDVLAGPLADRHRGLRATAGGRVLDLAPGTAAPAPSEGPYDTIVSAGWLPDRADLPATLRLLAGLLAPGGRLLVCEPERRSGAAGILSAVVPGDVPGHLDRDLSAAVWACGLRVVDADHVTVPDTPRALRRWLVAVACFPPTAPLGAPVDASDRPSSEEPP